MPRFLSAYEMYNELWKYFFKTREGNNIGRICFYLGDVSFDVNTKDAIGNLLQEWIKHWANSQNIYLRENESTQTFPDFYLSKSDEEDLLEIKTFDNTATPNFDIANFESYVTTLLEEPYKIDAKYIILGYSIYNGVLRIENIWYKNIWEITTCSFAYPLRVQRKKSVIYNIRPANFKNLPNNHFATKDEFLSAIQGTLNSYSKTSSTHVFWKDTFLKKYKEWEVKKTYNNLK